MTQPSGVQDTMKESGHDININCGLVPQTILEGAGDGLTGNHTLVNVYVDLLVFTRIADTS